MDVGLPPVPGQDPGQGPGIVVDARGLRCPLPIIRLAAAARPAVPGTLITLLSTDPAAEPDVAAWCRMRGAALVTQTWLADGTGEHLRSEVRTGGDRTPGGSRQG